MKILMKNNFGFSLVEGMVGLGLLAAVGVAALKLTESQKNTNKGQQISSELPRAITKIKRLITDPAACNINFATKTVGANTQVPSLKNMKGEVVLKIGQKIANGNYELSDLRLGDYSDLTQRTRLIFTFKNIGQGVATKTVNKVTNIYTQVVGNKIEKCLDPSQQTTDALKKRFCKDIDPKGTEDCEDNYINLLNEVKQLYCGPGHPFLTYDPVAKKCRALDANKSCGSGFMKGYDASGNLICYTIPTGPTTPPPGCDVWGAWSPSEASSCTTVTVTQRRTCVSGDPGTQTRTLQGTKNDSSCCKNWTAWSPATSATCSDKKVSQTRTCSSGWSGSDSRSVAGTKSCGSCTVLHPIGWDVPGCHCAEYYMPAGGTFRESTIPNNQKQIFFGNYCRMSQNASKYATGEITLSCSNGHLQFSNGKCTPGAVK